MGEARSNKTRRERLLQAEPNCIYCGEIAVDVDHMPPIILFDRRDRPKGMEFPACAACNGGTRLTDQVVAMIARAMSDASGKQSAPDFAAVMTAVRNNDLKTYLEFKPTPQQIAEASDVTIGGPINIGPRVASHMRVFLSKLGMTLFREVSGLRLPDRGAVRSRWYSNYQHMTGQIPSAMWDALPAFEALSQGRKTSFGQFEYTWQTDESQRLHRFIAVFRYSFVADIVTATDRSLLEELPGQRSQISPGELLLHIPAI